MTVDVVRPPAVYVRPLADEPTPRTARLKELARPHDLVKPEQRGRLVAAAMACGVSAHGSCPSVTGRGAPRGSLEERSELIGARLTSRLFQSSSSFARTANRTRRDSPRECLLLPLVLSAGAEGE